MTRKEEILAAYDEAFSDDWESLGYAIKDITEDEAVFQHPSYSDVEREEGHPPSGTILWHLVHLAHCYRHYISTIERRPEKGEDLPPPEANSVLEGISNLKFYRAKLRDAIAAVPDEQLDDEVFSYKTIAKFARMNIRHDAWHASQMVMMKRLYRKK